MSVDKETILERLTKLSQVIQLLERYRAVPKNDFLVDFTVNSAAQFNMILGIEIIVDIGSHILNEAYEVRPKEYQEVITRLGEYSIIPEDFAKANSDMAKFRNKVIHQYEDIDMKQVYEHLQKAPDIFRKFASHFMEYLQR